MTQTAPNSTQTTNSGIRLHGFISVGVHKGIRKGNCTYSRRPRHGFTLVELLVIIAIIAILSALLLPSLKKSRDSAVKATCANSLRNVGIASSQYVNDYYGYFPPFHSGTNTWHTLLGVPYHGEPDKSTGVYNHTPTIMASAFHCPADTQPHPTYGRLMRNIAINGSSGTENGHKVSGITMRRAYSIRKPSIVMFAGDGDSSMNSTEWGSCGRFSNPGTEAPRLMDNYSRHQDGMNFIMADGHAIWKHWTFVYEEFTRALSSPFFDWAQKN